jgi:hypothetical protein
VPNKGEVESLIKTLKNMGAGEQVDALVDGPEILDRAGSSIRDVSKSIGSTLDNLATKAVASGGRLPTPQEASSAILQQVDALRGRIPQDEIDKAVTYASRGTEEGILAARGLLDRAMEKAPEFAESASQTARSAAQSISVRATEVAKMSKEQLIELQKDASRLSDEALEAAKKRWEELNAR